MNKNTAKIKAGIRALSATPDEIISGIVVPGSTDESEYTVSVRPADGSDPIEGVMLNSTTENGNGMILFPADDSHVIIGCVDGPGEWILLRAGELTKAVVTIGNVKCELDGSHLNVQNAEVVFNISDSVFKMSTASESLFQLLKDCFTYIAALTVPTPSGTSSVPVNVADFNNLVTRLDNLLTS